MPYINAKAREQLDPFISKIPCLTLKRGELNYVVTRILLGTRPTSYDDFNSLIGVLECAKLEMYRRMVAPYENAKARENGDVYPRDRLPQGD